MLEALAALAKALLYAALLSAAGTPLAAASLRPSVALSDYATQVMRAAAIAVMVLNIAIAGLLFARLGGAFDQPTLSAVFASGPGAALVLQVAGAVLLLAPTDDESLNSWRMTSALTMTASVIFNGHAAAIGPAAGIVAMVHVTAAAWWVGSLWLLLGVCVAPDRDDIVRLVNRFSSLATRLVVGLIVAGVVLAITLLNFDAPLWLTDYVLVLAVKLAFVALVLGLATYNKFRLTPQLPREAPALRRSITAELGVIAGILMITAVLTTYFSPES